MKNALDSQSIEIPCPHCGKKSGQTIGRLKTVTRLTCRHCGQAFNVDASEMRRQITKVEAQLKKTLAAFGRLGK